jgi:transposase
LSWPLPAECTDAVLDAQLYPGNQGRPKVRPEPDWGQIHRDLQQKGVTLEVLWGEYRVEHPDGYGYTAFCQHYRRFRATLEVTWRQTYRPGEYAFVDYAGVTLPIYQPRTGAVAVQAQLFVMTLGYSHDTYAEWQPDQSLASWVQGHVNALTYFHGVPQIWVPDNLKAGVTRPDRYDPDLNRTYQECAEHYGAVILPARVRAPRDKGKVEKHVQFAETRLFAPVRQAHFLRVADANADLRPRLDALNAAPFQKLPGTRRQEWETVERPVLRALPPTPYTYAEWTRAKVARDYHIEVGRAFYSVPYTLVSQSVDVRVGALVVEIFHQGQRVASHARTQRGHAVTDPQHMPPHHRAYATGWDAATFRQRATAVGPHTLALIEEILRRAVVPEQAYRQCLGILALRSKYPAAILEAAAQRAHEAGTRQVRYLRAYCAQIQHEQTATTTVPPHANVRGAAYYADDTTDPDRRMPDGHDVPQ